MNPQLQDYAERVRLLHNRIRCRLPRAEQDELLELAIGLCMLALVDRRTETCASSSPEPGVS